MRQAAVRHRRRVKEGRLNMRISVGTDHLFGKIGITVYVLAPQRHADAQPARADVILVHGKTQPR